MYKVYKIKLDTVLLPHLFLYVANINNYISVFQEAKEIQKVNLNENFNLTLSK